MNRAVIFCGRVWLALGMGISIAVPIGCGLGLEAAAIFLCIWWAAGVCFVAALRGWTDGDSFWDQSRFFEMVTMAVGWPLFGAGLVLTKQGRSILFGGPDREVDGSPFQRTASDNPYQSPGEF